jgi:two-component system phosphate regulon sensor histidine kinase PhoR
MSNAKYHIFTVCFLVCLLAIALTGFTIILAVDYAFYRQTVAELKSKANLTLEIARDLYAQGEFAKMDSLAKTLGRASGTRISFIDAQGEVLGDTDVDPSIMENHSDRMEFKEAMKGKVWTSVRFSTTVKHRMLSVSLPVKFGTEVLGVVRVSSYFRDVNRTLLRIKLAGSAIVLVLIVIAGSFLFLTTRSLKLSLFEIKNNIARLAQEDTELIYTRPKFKELRELTKTLKDTALQIREKKSDIVDELNELSAIFENIKTGIIVVRQSENISQLNQSALKILQTGMKSPQGKSIQEVIVDKELQDFIGSSLKSQMALEEEITLGQSGIVLQVYSVPLDNRNKERIGALIVLNDISHLRKLENVRKEFVANVSHELRTPITAIKGFLENLLENNIKDKDEEIRFLNIIHRHTVRLNALLEDLMLLAKMEAGEAKVSLSRENLCHALGNAVEKCQEKARTKNINLLLDCSEDLNLRINLTLIEQGVMNLIDNALKFSHENSTVEITAYPLDKEVVISVKDYGVGIEPEHLPRLFERFYRVDKNRSRKEGGTGLGLSIVKHIALAHGGTVSVSSEPGKGSIFGLHLPR